METLDVLNEPQKRAVLHHTGALLIIAGAGAGKTKTVTHRIGQLISDGITPDHILAITFTNKAATEMRERASLLLRDMGISFGYGKPSPWIGTFHALGVVILREQSEILGLPKRFTVVDKSDSTTILKSAMKAEGIDQKYIDHKRIANIISREKNELRDPSELKNHIRDSYLAQVVFRVWKRYEALLIKEKSLDFDDLLAKTVLLFEKHPEILRMYQERWTHIHVDEYQDTNKVQYRLVTQLASRYKNICVVGDGDQNIYSWRGASIENILRFEEEYPGTTVVLLTQNYRSTKTILSAANAVIGKNLMRKAKDLFTENEHGEKITLIEAYDEGDEARRIAEKISSFMDQGVSPKDIAILYRTNFQSRALEEAMLNSGIPYQVLGTRFYDRKEVKDVLAYVRVAENPTALVDLGRVVNVPPRGIGKVTLEKMLAGDLSTLNIPTRKKVEQFHALIARIAEQSQLLEPAEYIRYILKETGIERALASGDDDDKERLGNVEELVSLATKYSGLPAGEGLSLLLADVALASDQDNLRSKEDSVRLMTVHAAKGLEFPTVFITGLEQDLFPSRRNGEAVTPDQKEEERRLFYVAITRAGKHAVLSYASYRMIFGTRQVNIPSEFIEDIPEDLVITDTRGSGQAKTQAKRLLNLSGWGDNGNEEEPIVYF